MSKRNQEGNSEGGRSKLVRRLSAQSGRVADEVRELGRVAVAEAAHAAAHLREKGKHALGTGVKRARKAKVRFDELIAENPVKSLLIALGAGALLGFILRRKS